MNIPLFKYRLHKLTNKQYGFSIVELMIAIFIGLIVLTGLITVFDSSSRMSRTQNGLARIQENGRYALSLMRPEIAQAGYQYCNGTSNQGVFGASAIPKKVGWDIQATNFIPGFPAGPSSFDPGYLVFGHECNAGACNPILTETGADLPAAIPIVGVNDGDRIAGTDVLTIRYLAGRGREVDAIAGNIVTFTADAVANPPTVMPAAGEILLVDCSDTSPMLLDISANGPGSLTTVQMPPQFAPGDSNLMKAFNFQRDFVTMTYFVANNIVDGRSIPTLYRSFNGTRQPVIEGVDAFDVVYGVSDINNATQFLTADEVQTAMTAANCWPAPYTSPGVVPIVNNAGCGWRSVISIELHMLLNTIYNSSHDADEAFRYSPYGNAYFTQANLPSTIPHYSMHRREFFTTIALKNIMH